MVLDCPDVGAISWCCVLLWLLSSLITVEVAVGVIGDVTYHLEYV